MVKILNPPTPRAHCASNSDRLVNDLEVNTYAADGNEVSCEGFHLQNSI